MHTSHTPHTILYDADVLKRKYERARHAHATAASPSPRLVSLIKRTRAPMVASAPPLRRMTSCPARVSGVSNKVAVPPKLVRSKTDSGITKPVPALRQAVKPSLPTIQEEPVRPSVTVSSLDPRLIRAIVQASHKANLECDQIEEMIRGFNEKQRIEAEKAEIRMMAREEPYLGWRCDA